MSVLFEVQSAAGPYQVTIQSLGIQSQLRDSIGVSVIADKFFAPWFETLHLPVIFVEATEENKSLDASPAMIEQLRKSGVNRQTQLAAIGGGIVQDMSAFIASVYMRGLVWNYFPTTILAMVDSCIGGKSSINVGPYKNLVGTFHPPKQVFIDPSLAQTLPDDQKASGLIEAAKICFCRSREHFEKHLSYNPSVSIGTEALEGVIVNSLESKKWFIEIDEFDKKERLLLNFGHTFGHAIEGATHFGVSHGIAVGLGILCALEFGRAQGTDYSGTPSIKMLENHLEQMISSVPGLADHLRAMPPQDVVERFASDKKHTTENFTIIIVTKEGEVVLRPFPKSREIIQAIQDAVQMTVERFV